MIERGMIEKEEEKKHLRTTQLWYDEFVLVKKSYQDGKESLPSLVKKVYHPGKESLPNNNIYNNNDNKKKVKEKTPPFIPFDKKRSEETKKQINESDITI